MKEDAVFYVGQKAFIEKNGQVLVLNSPLGGVDYPGGKIQEGEFDLIESLKREVREETGLEISVGEPFATWIGVFPSQHRLAGKKVFLVGYKCVCVSGDVILSNEHNKLMWVTKDTFNDIDDGTAYFEILKKYFA